MMFLNILIAFLGVLFVLFTLFEWRKLRSLNSRFASLEKSLTEQQYAQMKAAHRVIASYSMQDVDAKIALLESAVQISPHAFNAFNALGYAYLEKGLHNIAIDAFNNAIRQHPDDPAGYCDLGFALLEQGEQALAVKHFKKAIQIEPGTLASLRQDSRLAGVSLE